MCHSIMMEVIRANLCHKKTFLKIFLMNHKNALLEKRQRILIHHLKHNISYQNIGDDAVSYLDQNSNFSNDRKVFKSAPKVSKSLFYKSVTLYLSVGDVSRAPSVRIFHLKEHLFLTLLQRKLSLLPMLLKSI